MIRNLEQNIADGLSIVPAGDAIWLISQIRELQAEVKAYREALEVADHAEDCSSHLYNAVFGYLSCDCFKLVLEDK